MKKYLSLTIIAVLALACFLTYQYFIFNDHKLHIVFCNVGQGDGILVRTPAQKYILIDSGPDKSILDCLGRHMPLWQRDIDLALLSHPHTDHFMGFYYVSDRYHIKAFATENLDNKTPGFQMLLSQLREKKIPSRHVLQGDRFKLDNGVSLDIEGPSLRYLNMTSPGGQIGDSKEFASVITKVSYGSFSTLLSGDSQAVGLEDALGTIGGPVTILQSPHHGSATGLSAELLEKLAPKLAVISVGKNNYGHPALATLYLLKDIPTKRTDKVGDIEIITDGQSWKPAR
jgi:competence protein ComEC